MGWLADYDYRKPIPITGQAGAGTDYQVPLKVHPGAGEDAPGVVYLNGHCQEFPNDIRFTDDDGATELDHWLEDFLFLPGKSGAWCWFQDPRAIHYEGAANQTYVVYVNSDGDVCIWCHNHTTGVSSETVLNAGFEVDEHAAPSMHITGDGHILVFYSQHCGADIYMRKSTNPEDISAFDAEQSILNDVNLTYPNPVEVSSGRIFLFYRKGTSTDADIYYITSDDDGDNWAAPTQFSNWGSECAYLKVVASGSEIHVGISTSEGGTSAKYDIHYLYSPNNGTSWQERDATVIALPVTPLTAELVYESDPGVYCWIWDIAVDGDNYPWIAFADDVGSADHKYKCVKWDGDSWDTAQIAASNYDGLYATQSHYSGGVVLDHDDPTYAYGAVYTSNNYEIQRFHYAAGVWSKSDDITSGTHKWNIRPVYVRNAHADIKVVWMRGDYDSMYLYRTEIFSPEPGDEANFWVEIKDDLTNNQTFYIYYGKPGVASDSDGDATFIFFDDFPGAALDVAKWVTRQGAIGVGRGNIELIGIAGVRGLIDGLVAIGQGAALHAKTRWSDTGQAAQHFCVLRKSNDWSYRAGDIYGAGAASAIDYQTWDDGDQTSTLDTAISTPMDWHIYKVLWTLNLSRAYQDAVLKVSHNTDVPIVDNVVAFYEASTAVGTVYADWILVRKYVTTEPTVGTAGAEEGVPPPVPRSPAYGLDPMVF